MKKIEAEIIIIGAGPAGLGAGLSLSKAGKKVIILEKQDAPGLLRRGETIRFNKEMEALLGKEFFESQTIHRINKRRYYSHTGLMCVDRTISSPNLIINFTDFVQALAARAVKAGAEIRTGVGVSGLIEEDGFVDGVKIKEGEGEYEIRAKAVISCGGFKDPGFVYSAMSRDAMDNPVQKRIVKDYLWKEDRLEYHFHCGKDGLFVTTIFPRSAGEAELITMRISGSSKPDIDAFAAEHPVFREHISGFQTVYSIDTLIPMGAMIKDCVSAKGIIMAGDALGHVQGRGEAVSGLLS